MSSSIESAAGPRTLAGATAVRRRASSIAGRLEQEFFVVLTLAGFTLLLVAALPAMLRSDSWLSLVAGREAWIEGLPRVDSLTSWAAGREWIDQQWLGHVLLYGLERLGGVQALLAVNVVAVVSAVGIACLAARGRGASAGVVAAAAIPCMAAVAMFAVLRPQTLVLPLFALLVALCSRESRAPSRRILFAAPLLLLWANLHGSALLAAGLVALLGLTELPSAIRGGRPRRAATARAAALVAAPFAALLATPYGLRIVDYYGTVLGHGEFSSLVSEWKAPTLTGQPLFFVLALVGGWLVASRRGALTLWERLAFVALLVGGLVAVRNGVWFALLCLVVVPVAAERMRAERRQSSRSQAPRRVRLNLALAGAAALVALLAVGQILTRDQTDVLRGLEPVAATAVAHAAASGGVVLAEPALADWLLWHEPTLRGRLAFDARFELLTSAELVAIRDLFLLVGPDWDRALRDVRVVVLERGGNDELRAALTSEPLRFESRYDDGAVAVFERAAR